MKKEQYVHLTGIFRDHPGRTGWINIANKLLTGIVFAAYPLFLLNLLITGNPAFLRAVLVPLTGFLLVSAFRNLVNRKRPYETFDMPPVIPKKTRGKSFPSRHVFSAAVIGATVFAVGGLEIPGLILLTAAAGLAVIRVLTGIHYPEDCLAGFLLGLLMAWIGFGLF